MLSIPTTAAASKDGPPRLEDDPLVDGPLVRRLVVALVCSGVLCTLALVLLMGSLLDLSR